MPEIATFTVTLNTPATAPCSLHYATVNGTAVAPADYTSTTGVLNFVAGDTTKTIVVPILADITANVDKAFTMSMSSPDGLILASTTSGICVISTAGSTPPALTVSITGVSISADPASPVLTALHAVGNQFVDAAGNTVQLRGINWYGYDGTDLVPHGLYTGRSYTDILDQIAQLGFNCIRFPFCDDMITSTAVFNNTTGDQYVSNANPDLIGLTPLQSLVPIIRYAASIGIYSVLDHHRISMTSSGDQDPSGFGTDSWPAADPTTGTYLYGGSTSPRPYTAATWAAMWSTLATFCTTGDFATDPVLKNAIVGFDAHNEPHNLSWATWAGMVEALFPIVNAIAPDWMMFVEGVGASADGTDMYCWGGYLKDVATRPVNLGAQQNKLAYSAHEYGQSVAPQTWLSSVAAAGGDGYPALPANTVPGYPDSITAIREAYYMFIPKQGIAPMWVGEFGAGLGLDATTGLPDPLQTNATFEAQWLDNLVADLGTNNTSFAYFSYNPESGNPLGGMAENKDYLTIQHAKMDALLPLLSQQ